MLETSFSSERVEPADSSRFVHITRTAQRLFDVPLAFIALTDEIPFRFVAPASAHLDAVPSWCAQALPFLVEDAGTDAPLRFRAGCALHDVASVQIGMMVIADHAPRAWRSVDDEALRDLAAWAETELQQHALQQSESRLHAIVENVADGIITLDQYGLIVSLNRAAARIFGYQLAEVVGQNIKVLMPSRYHEAHDGYLQNFRDTGTTRVIGLDREVTGRRKDGSLFPMELTVNEMWLHGRRGFAGIIRDVTERKRMEKTKNEFISTVAHELRTPLTSIRGSLGLLAGGVMSEIPEHAKNLLNIANSNCERLVRLVNDILDTEKIESGHMHFKLVAQRMLPLVEEACAATRDFAAAYQVRFHVQGDAPDACVAVDGDRIVQVIVNLLSNAAKFSPPGGSVQVRLTRSAQMLRLSVIDQGPGIAESFRDRVFLRFAQADSSDARQKSGTGLGLPISRAIVERHHGRIDFNCAPGAGCEFYFELPLAAAPAEPA